MPTAWAPWLRYSLFSTICTTTPQTSHLTASPLVMDYLSFRTCSNVEDLPGSRCAAGGSAGKEAPPPSAHSQDDCNHKNAIDGTDCTSLAVTQCIKTEQFTKQSSWPGRGWRGRPGWSPAAKVSLYWLCSSSGWHRGAGGKLSAGTSQKNMTALLAKMQKIAATFYRF